MAIIASLFCTISTVVAAYNWWKTPTEESGTTRTRQLKKEIRVENGVSNVSKIVSEAMAEISVRQVHVQGIFIKGSLFLTTDHLFVGHDGNYIKDDEPIVLRMPNRETPQCFLFKHKNLIKIPDKDLAIYDFGKEVTPRRDIISHFINGNEPLTNQPAMNISFKPEEGTLIQHYTVKKEGEQASYFRYEKIYTVTSTFGEYASESGSCGSLCMLNNAAVPKIFGVHVASYKNGTKVATCVTNVMLNSAIKDRDVIVREYPQSESGVFNPYAVNDLEDAGKALKASRRPTKTTLVKSLLFDQITKHTTEPSILSMNDSRMKEKKDILKEAIHRYSKCGQPNVDEEEVIEIMQEMGKEMNEMPSIRLTRKLTTYEAINGIENYPYLDSLPMDTSAGGEFALLGIKKKDIFDKDENDKYVLKEQYAREFEQFESSLRNGVIPENYYTGMLKDERLKLKKIYDEPKTRLFSMSPLYLTLATRKYLLPCIAHMFQNCYRTWFGPGINRAGVEWHHLICYLKEVGSNGFDIDYRNWDGKVPKKFLIHLDEFFFSLDVFSIEEKKAVRCILLNSTYAVELISDKYVIRDGTVPSGWALTIVINCILNELYSRLCWKRVVPRPYNDLYYYKMNVRNSHTGDDTIKTVSQDFIEYFNFETMKDVLTSWQLDVTPADKDAGDYKYKPVEQLMYLKCTTVKSNGLYLPKMDYDSLMEQLNWVRLSSVDQDVRTQTEEIANNVLRCLYTHGKEKFNEIRDKILALQPDFKLMPYKAAHTTFMHFGRFPGYDYDGIAERKMATIFGDQHRLLSMDFATAESSDDDDVYSRVFDNTLQHQPPTMSVTHYATVNEKSARFFSILGTIENLSDGTLSRIFDTICKEIARRNKENLNSTSTKITTRVEHGILHMYLPYPQMQVAPSLMEIETLLTHIQSIDLAVLKLIYRKIQLYKQDKNLLAIAESSDVVTDVLGNVIKAVNPTDLLLSLLDKPQLPTQPMPVTIKTSQYNQSTEGEEHIQVLQAHPTGQQFVDKEHFGFARDETNIRFLVSKMTYVTTLNWNVTDTVGSILFETWVGPMSRVQPIQTEQDVGVIAFVGRHFKYWRGGMKYTIDFVCSNYHEGKLDITWHPFSMNAPANVTTAVSQYLMSYSLKDGRNKITVKVPYMSETPYRKVYAGQNLSDVYDEVKGRFQDYFSGTLAFRVAAPLKAPQTVVSSIQMNIFEQAADDFTFAELAVNNSSIQLAADTTKFWQSEYAEVQSGEKPEVYEEQQVDEFVTEDDLADNDVLKDESVGVTLGEKEYTEIITSRAVMSNLRAEKHLGDLAWDVRKMLSRWSIVDNISWPMSTQPGTMLSKMNVLTDMLKQTINSAPFALFHEFRCKSITVKAQMVASKFHQGRALMTFIPVMVDYTKVSKKWNTNDYLYNPHVFLDPTNGTAAELEIPFRHFKGFLDLVNKDVLGMLTIQVFNQLNAVTGASNASEIKLWMKVNEPEFKVPRPGGTSFNKMMENGLFAKAEAGETTINDTNANKAVTLAPTEIRVTDPKVHHFGDNLKTLNELGKRYVINLIPGQPETIDASLNSSLWAGSIVADLARMYVCFRGSTCFKIKTQHSVDHLPFYCAGFTQGESNMPTSKNPYMEYLTLAPKAFVYGDEMLEFKIPHQSLSAVQLVGTFNVVPAGMSNYVYKNELWFGHMVQPISMIVMAALGDEAAFGVFFSIPNVVLRPTWPDSWSSPKKIKGTRIVLAERW